MTATLTATLPTTACPHCGEPVTVARFDGTPMHFEPNPAGRWVISDEGRAYVRELLEKRWPRFAWIDELLAAPQGYESHFVTCRRDR